MMTSILNWTIVGLWSALLAYVILGSAGFFEGI